MDTQDIPEALTGEPLIAAIHSVKEKRQPLVDGFLYENTLQMISADPGTGKSTIAIQAAVEMASGVPVWGNYEVPRPLKVMWIQSERSLMEPLERIELITKTLPLAKNNLFLSDGYQGLNLLNPDHVRILIACIKRDCPNVDVITFDPIYPLVAGGLKDDIPASHFTKAMTLLQRDTGATLWYNHHTVKAQYQDNKKIEKDDPFYGSQWLKAHVTGSFYLRECTGGVRMERKKDNYRLLPAEIMLEYNSESGLCSIPSGNLPALDKIKAFLRHREVDQKEFSFQDLEAATQVCTRRLRELLVHSSISGRIYVVSSIKNRNLYKAHAQEKSCAVQLPPIYR